MRKTLLVVDGHNLLFQMFFGMPNKIHNKDGININGVIGFIGALIKIINKTESTHVVVLFDSEQANSRNDIIADYKQNRIDYSTVAIEDNPFSQLEYIYKALDYMEIKHCEVIGFETDDVIASYALKYKNDIEIIISSFDSDFFQLIDDTVKILRYKGDNSYICDLDYIINKFNITSNQYADFKSLVGDPADNIKGVKSIGPKTAAKLINEFGDIETLVRNHLDITPPRIRQLITDNLLLIQNNYKVIKLALKDNLPFELCELKLKNTNYKTTEILTSTKIK